MFYKKIKKQTYNRDEQKPIIRSSICTGEKVAGFKDIHTGKFTEVMAIKNNKDLDVFLKQYDIEVAEIKTEYQEDKQGGQGKHGETFKRSRKYYD